MKTEATRADAYQLMHEGSLAMGDIERRGIRIDLPYCKKTVQSLEGQINQVSKKLLNEPEVKKWKARVGSRFKLGANGQLAKHLYVHLKLTPPIEFTEEDGELAEYHAESQQDGPVDQASLFSLKIPWLRDIVRLRKLKHASDQLTEVLREQVDGFLHPIFNLHLARTYRSSCERINFQNKSARDKEIAELVRRAFIPRKPSNCILETDYKGIEVSVSCCNHKDRNMISYVSDDKKDMHRDLAMLIFKLLMDQVSKTIRHASKNGFVFPEFYGSYWKKVAPNLWTRVVDEKLTLSDGSLLLNHLKACGLGTFDRFEKHVRKIENIFWYDMFAEYTEWKKRFWAAYLKRGYFDTLTGFRCSGVMRRTQALNYPIQGPAFHCLLWSLIRLNKPMAQMKALLIGQIHDSMLTDVPEKILPEVVALQNEITSIRLRKHWQWINVPMKVEYECAPVGESWWKKAELKVSA